MIGVLIPAHNEQALIAHCLHAVLSASRHPQLKAEPVRVLVVLDSCDDLSADIAAQYDVDVLAINARNVGAARGAGAQWLLERGARWISCTDADSRVAEDWLVAQLALGKDAVCGTVTGAAPSMRPPAPATRRPMKHGTAIGISMAPTWASVPTPTGAPGDSSRWRVTKTCTWSSSWRRAARPSPGATARKSSPAPGSTAAPQAALVIT